DRDVGADRVGILERSRRMGSRWWICDRFAAAQILHLPRGGGCAVTARLTSYTVARASSCRFPSVFRFGEKCAADTPRRAVLRTIHPARRTSVARGATAEPAVS